MIRTLSAFECGVALLVVASATGCSLHVMAPATAAATEESVVALNTQLIARDKPAGLLPIAVVDDCLTEFWLASSAAKAAVGRH